MYDVLILLLGFEPGPLVRAVAAHPLSSKGKIIVLTPTFRDERCERAFLDFQRIIKMMLKDEKSSESVPIERYEITLNPISKGVQEIRGIFYNISNYKVLIALTGGMRALGLTTFIAYLTIPWSIEPDIIVYLEGRGEFIKIPHIRNVFETTTLGIKGEILSALSKEAKTISQLAIELNRDRSVIYRHVAWLQEKGLVKRTNKVVELTELGKLFALPK